MFCDLSTNSWKYVTLIIIQMDFSKCGIDYRQIGYNSNCITNMLKNNVKIFCDFLLILLNIKYCKYEFSVTDNLKCYRPHLLAHNHYNNDESDNDNNEKNTENRSAATTTPKNISSMSRLLRILYIFFINLMTCIQQKPKTFSEISRESKSVYRPIQLKNHSNAIVFLLILCIPIITVHASVHNIKYSTNIVKTKYGPLRGILIRSNPTIEAYLGVPYATPPVGSLR